MLRAIRRSFRKSKKDKAPPATQFGTDIGQKDDNVIGLVRQLSTHHRHQLSKAPSSLSSASSSSSSSLNSLMDAIGHLEVVEEVRSAEATVERRCMLPSCSVSSTTMPSVRSRSLPERFQHATTGVDFHLANSSAVVNDHNDSGFGVEIIGHHDEPQREVTETDCRRPLRLQRQDVLQNSNSSISGDDHATVDIDSKRSSSNLSFRRGRHRGALRSFRNLSQEFLRRTFRPSCVRPSSDFVDDDNVNTAYVPTTGLGDIVTGVSPPSTGLLAVDTSNISTSSLNRNRSRRKALSHHFLRHAVAGSSSADIRSLLRDVDTVSAVAAGIVNATTVGTSVGASTSVCRSVQSSNSDLATLPSSIEADVWADRLNGDPESGQSSPSSSSTSADQV